MPATVIFEDSGYVNLLPLVYWRLICELRLGFDTLLDKVRTAWWQVPLRLFVRPCLADVVAERSAPWSTSRCQTPPCSSTAGCWSAGPSTYPSTPS